MFNRNISPRQFEVPDLDEPAAPVSATPPVQNRKGESIPAFGGSFKVQNTLVDDPELGQTHQGTWVSRSTETVLPGELDFGPNRADMNFTTSPEKDRWHYEGDQPNDQSDQMTITQHGMGPGEAWLAVGFKEERSTYDAVGSRIRALRDEQRPK